MRERQSWARQHDIHTHQAQANENSAMEIAPDGQERWGQPDRPRGARALAAQEDRQHHERGQRQAWESGDDQRCRRCDDEQHEHEHDAAIRASQASALDGDRNQDDGDDDHLTGHQRPVSEAVHKAEPDLGDHDRIGPSGSRLCGER